MDSLSNLPIPNDPNSGFTPLSGPTNTGIARVNPTNTAALIDVRGFNARS